MHQITLFGPKGFVTGSIKEPNEDSVENDAWETGNAIVKGWLINSMDPTIMGFFIHLRTAKEVWEEVARTYYDGSDISQIYELKVKPIKIECALDLKTLREEVQLDRVYAFLAGLDDVFDKVRSDILRTPPLPSLEEVFSVVRREAQHHATMMRGSAAGNQGGTLPVAMMSQPSSSGRPYGPSSSPNSCPFTRENKDDLKCTFCWQTRHMEYLNGFWN
ncbi:uncharacterized protein [Malus domestica]|uniref:uncharacterized protein n=1 Tax=Malus domestica TaxID=3750 RepID=UPI003974B5A0